MNLRQLRTFRQLTTRDMARRLRVNELTIKMWEWGTPSPRQTFQDAFSEIYKVSVEDIRTTLLFAKNFHTHVESLLAQKSMSLETALIESHTIKANFNRPSVFFAQACYLSLTAKRYISVDVVTESCDGWERGYYLTHDRQTQRLDTSAELDLRLIFEYLVRVDQGWIPFPDRATLDESEQHCS